ncbi:hypothetical protein AALA22_09030 [Anaerovoracaceae bacterium 41-7]
MFKQLIALLLSTGLLCPILAQQNLPQRYEKMHAVVNSSYTENGIGYTSFKTEDGNKWSVADDTWTVGKKCTIYFDTQFTEDIYDDEIIRIVPRWE